MTTTMPTPAPWTTPLTAAPPTVSAAKPAPLRAYVAAPDPALRATVLNLMRGAGVPPATMPEHTPGVVVVAAADTVEAAVRLCPPAGRGYRTLVVADRFSPFGVLLALRAGIGAMLRTCDTDPARMLAALRSAHDGEGRIPHDVLIQVLRGGGEPPVPAAIPAPRFPLTPRQTSVLALMAEGQGNAGIARSLSCSEHTVKNVIYELMARLQARNRAHAVAYAVRAGLI